MHRRRVLELLNAALGAALAAAVAWPVLSFVTWRPRREREVVFGPEDQAPMTCRQGVCLASPDPGTDSSGTAAPEAVALDLRCTHLCCVVTFDRSRGVFRCPCHHSVYDDAGRRLRGPADEDLARLPVERRPDGSLVVRVPL